MNSNSSPSPAGDIIPRTRGGGPKTPEGKAKSRMNALKHGAYALKLPVLRTECQEAYQEHLNLYYRRFNPADEPEKNLVAQIAFIDWRITRLATLETQVIDSQFDSIESSPFTPDGTGQAESTVAAINRALQQPCLNYIARRESALARQRSRNLKDLAELRRSHPVLDPEPEFMPDPVHPGNTPEPEPEPEPALEPAPRPTASPILLPPFSAAQINLTKRTPGRPGPALLYQPERRDSVIYVNPRAAQAGTQQPEPCV
jgi:hypothetical protein